MTGTTLFREPPRMSSGLAAASTLAIAPILIILSKNKVPVVAAPVEKPVEALN